MDIPPKLINPDQIDFGQYANILSGFPIINKEAIQIDIPTKATLAIKDISHEFSIDNKPWRVIISKLNSFLIEIKISNFSIGRYSSTYPIDEKTITFLKKNFGEEVTYKKFQYQIELEATFDLKNSNRIEITNYKKWISWYFDKIVELNSYDFLKPN